MIKAAIIEDSLLNRERLKKLLLKIDETLDVVLEVGTKNDIGFVKNCVKLIDTEKPDIVFLDVILRQGTGFDVLEQVTFKDFYLVVLTREAREKCYTNKGHQYSRYIGFLQKPFIFNEIKDIIRIFKNKIQESKNLPIPCKESIKFIKPSNIVLCRNKNRDDDIDYHAEFQYKNDSNKFDSIISSQPLEYFKEKYTTLFATFFDTGKDCYINETFIENIPDRHKVRMKNGTEIELDIEKDDEFLTKYGI